MTELFDSIVLEIFINGAWTDCTSDLLVEPRPHWNAGKMTNTFESHVGDPEIFTFSLNNEDSKYSLGHASMLTGWATGLKVRLGFGYDGNAVKYMYKGVIKPDGIIVIPSEKGARRVDVTCNGFMGRAASHNLDLVTIAENVKLEAAIQLILDNMPIAPETVEFGTGQSTFTTFFDTVSTDTSALAEMERAATSEMGWVATTDGDNLITFGRDDLAGIANTPIPKSLSESGYLLNETSGYLLNETGGKIILDEATTATFDNVFLNDSMELSYGKNYVNRVKTNAYPRRVDTAATTVLWSLESAIEIPANETKTGIRGTYRNPNGGAKTTKGKEMVTPVSGTDFVANSARDGSGSNQTANMSVTAILGTTEAEFTIVNSSGASIWTGGDAGTFQVRGKGIYFDDVATNSKKDADLIAVDGIKEIEFDFRYQDNPTVTEDFNNFYLTQNKVKHTTIERVSLLANRSTTNMNGFLYLRPFTRARFSETKAAIDEDFFIVGYDAEIVSGKYVIWTPTLMRAADFDFSLWEDGFRHIEEPFTTPSTTIFTHTVINGGAGNVEVTSDENRNGIAQFSSASVASFGSGAQLYKDTNYNISTNGSLETYLWLKVKNVKTFGSLNLTDLSNGSIYISIDDATGKIFGTCGNGGSSTQTATGYTYALDTWYKARIFINQSGTEVTFELYNNYNSLLWSDSVTTNIPTAVNLDAYITFQYNGNPSVSNVLAYVDYFSMGYQHD